MEAVGLNAEARWRYLWSRIPGDRDPRPKHLR